MTVDCIGPLKPDDMDLLAYADDDASPSVQEHVARCVACQLRATTLRAEQRALRILLHRGGCPAPLELGEYQLKLLAEPRAEYVAGHLDYCPACRNEVTDLNSFMARLRRRGQEAAEYLFGSLRSIRAQLTLAPLGGPADAAVPVLRSAGDATTGAPLVYSAEDLLVTVDSWTERPGQPSRVVAGLVVGPEDFTGAEASMDAEVLESRAPIDNLGNFLFSEVSPGPHHLMIRLPSTGVQIEIAELIVK